MKTALILVCALLSACTNLSITIVSTKGQASDVVDESQDPTTHVDPEIKIPASIIGK